MDWETLIDERVQTTTWDMNKEVSKDIVDEIMSEVHKRSASKQNVVRYNIHIYVLKLAGLDPKISNNQNLKMNAASLDQDQDWDQDLD